MNAVVRRFAWWVVAVAVGVGGCGGDLGRGDKQAEVVDLGLTIGSVADIYAPETIAVEGYGLVGGLRGTGSKECPSGVRAYLTRYILTQLPESNVDVSKLIESTSTAVVRIEGQMPVIEGKGSRFDVRVRALEGTQTTSLLGGWLYASELKLAGQFAIGTRTIGTAAGAVFVDQSEDGATDWLSGYVLGGGRVLIEPRIVVVLSRPDFEMASKVRNRLNERFGEGVAKAISPARIEVTVPAEYRGRARRFISMLETLYLDEQLGSTEERITALVARLASRADKYEIELALEGIGRQSLSKLQVLLNSSDEAVRFHAARCMLYLGSDAGFGVLRQIALDPHSAYRRMALEAIRIGARRSEAGAVLRRLLRDSDFQIRLAAYEQLRALDDVAVRREFVGRSFYLEQVSFTDKPVIYVWRSGSPCIVLFGAPIFCRDNAFVQSADGTVIINARRGDDSISVVRRHPTRPDVVVRLKCSFDLSDIIRTLGEEPARSGKEGRGGLGVSYTEVVGLLKQMVERRAVDAEFRASDLPKIGRIVKK